MKKENSKILKRKIVYQSRLRNSPLGSKHKTTVKQSYRKGTDKIEMLSTMQRQGPPFAELYYMEENIKLKKIDDSKSELRMFLAVMFSKDVSKTDFNSKTFKIFFYFFEKN